MPLTLDRRYRLLRAADELYQDLQRRHYDAAPRGGVPVGGGEWMDTFFRCEALRGFINRLRAGGTVPEAVADGKAVSSVAVEVWNGRREFQVRRWPETAHDFLDVTARRLLSAL